MNSISDYLVNLCGLVNHVGIITGASKGLGRATAEVLTNSGATVFSFSRSKGVEIDEIDMAELTASRENSKANEAGTIIDVKIDINDNQSSRKAVEKIAGCNGGAIDFLVNNAGVTIKKRAEDFEWEEYRKVMDTNLDAGFLMCQNCYPYLKKSQYIGRIVNIASMGAYMGFVKTIPYCISKAGVGGLTRSLSVEWANDNILVNSVAPGWFITDLNKKMYEEDPARGKAAMNKFPLDHFGDPLEIGYAVLFLLGSGSTYMTGQTINVDGGALAFGF